MTVKSVNTRNLTKAELDKEDARIKEMTARSFVGFCLVPVFGYIAVCIASPVAWIAADLFLIPAYRHVMKNLNQLFYGRSRATDAAQ